MMYVVKQRKCGDWIVINAASPSEAAKRAARSCGLSGNAWLLVAEGKDGFSQYREFEVYFLPGKRLILLI